MVQIFPKEVKIKSGEILLIREAEKEDARAIIDYLNVVGGETDYLTFGAGEFEMSVEDEVDFIESHNKAPNCLLLVAELDGDIIAVSTITAGKRARQAHIGDFGITVLKKHWGKGVGSAALRRALDWAGASGVIRKINLKVQTDNEAAIGLYEKFGFMKEGTVKRDTLLNGKFHDSFVMGCII